MSTEHYPYPAYYLQPQQSGAQPSQAAHGAYYPAGTHPVAPAVYSVPPQGVIPAGAYQPQQSTPFFNFANDRFLKGLLIGAAATYLLTNESVQRTAIKGAVKAWGFLQGGVEEIKERFQDAEAELHAAEAEKEQSDSATES